MVTWQGGLRKSDAGLCDPAYKKMKPFPFSYHDDIHSQQHSLWASFYAFNSYKMRVVKEEVRLPVKTQVHIQMSVQNLLCLYFTEIGIEIEFVKQTSSNLVKVGKECDLFF